MELNHKRIVVTGGSGFLGSRVVEELLLRGAEREAITIPRQATSNLRIWDQCVASVEKQDVVIHLAAHVGGIGLNQQIPGELFYNNLLMGIQLMEAARQAGVKKFVSIGTICAYPAETPIPFHEADLWKGYPETTNAPYGLAKKMLLVQGQAYRKQYGFSAIYLLPVNLYGPGDNFDPASSHVIPALIRKIAEATKREDPAISVWGTGNATREFLYVQDAARGIVDAAEKYDDPEPVNLGSGKSLSIRELTLLLCKLMNYKGEITWDHSKPDGQRARELDVTRAKEYFGFSATTSFEDGLRQTINWYLNSLK